MQVVLPVDKRQGVQKWSHEPVELELPWRAAKALQPRFEALALLELQDHVAGVVGPEIAVDTDDVAVVELGQRLRLGDEALQPPLIITG